MFDRSEAQDHVTDEYGGRFRRLYPWEGVASPPWGGAIMTIAPGDSSTPHNHDEEETFIFLSGEGVMSVDDETRRVGKGDVVYLPRFSRHLVKNVSPDNWRCYASGGVPHAPVLNFDRVRRFW